MKMEKTPRYTQRERNMVLGFAAQYKDVIENKRTDAESNRKKDEVWRQIAKEFNCRVYHQRSSKQLRQLYKNMKLLLKKDLCGDGKSNRSFMDILNALSQQDSVAQYIQEQMSPGGYSSSRQQKFDDDFDDSKLPSVAYDGLDNDVIVIKSEDISDNEQSSHNGVGGIDDMDDDDDDCLSTKDIPEVCLEEEDDEIFATDLRQTTTAAQQQAQTLQQQLQAVQQQRQTPPQPEITIQNVGGIRVGSIGNIASLTNAAKVLQNASNNNNNSSNGGGGSSNNINSGNTNGNSALNISVTTTAGVAGSNRNTALSAAEQQQREQQQQLLFSGLGLSAVNTAALAAAATAAADQQQQLPTLQHATQRNSSHQSHSNNHNSSHHSLSSIALNSSLLLNKIPHTSGGNSSHHHHHNNNNNNSSSSNHNSNNRNNDYLMSLAIEERKRKIDLLNAQIEYWKTLTKKLDANNGHNPTPSCLCHFPAKVNGLQSQQSSS